MTPRAKPARTCPECVLTGSWHYSGDGSRSWRCPNYLSADLTKQAQRLTEAANEAATVAARQFIEDAARAHYEFSANTIREQLETLPGPVVGAAFTWAAGKAGLIEGTGRRVMSTDSATRHKIEVWRSKVWRGATEERTA